LLEVVLDGNVPGTVGAYRESVLKGADGEPGLRGKTGSGGEI
jgi:hypothetical protein